jgi:hypothetical protein
VLDFLVKSARESLPGECTCCVDAAREARNRTLKSTRSIEGRGIA